MLLIVYLNNDSILPSMLIMMNGLNVIDNIKIVDLATRKDP